MIAGCYSMDLYCENADPSSEGFRKPCPDSWHNFPHVFTGETEGECFRDARGDGWLITRDRKAYCPKCSGKQRRDR